LFIQFFCDTAAPSGSGPSHYQGFMITLRHTTLSRTYLDEAVWCRNLYLTTHNTYKKQTSFTPVGFRLANPANERLQTHALDHMATGIGFVYLILCVNTVCAVKVVFIECTLRLSESELY